MGRAISTGVYSYITPSLVQCELSTALAKGREVTGMLHIPGLLSATLNTDLVPGLIPWPVRTGTWQSISTQKGSIPIKGILLER